MIGAIMAEAVVAEADLRGERGGAAADLLQPEIRITADATGLDIHERAHLVAGRRDILLSNSSSYFMLWFAIPEVGYEPGVKRA
jgi:hypothetical protein